jgi:hypothetical protein
MRRTLFVVVVVVLFISQTGCHKVCDCDEGLSTDTITLRLVNETVNEAGFEPVLLRIIFKTHVFGEDEFAIEADYASLPVPAVPNPGGSAKQIGPIKGTYKLDGDRIRFKFLGRTANFDKLIDPGVTYFLECHGKEFKIKGAGRELTFKCDKR